MPVFFEEKKRMPHDRELVAITGLRPTHALCTLVEHIITCEPLAQEAMRRLLPERRCAHLPLLGTEAKTRMPHDRVLVAITGLRPAHALCTLVEHIITCEPLAQEAMRRLLPERRCAHLPLLGTVT